MNVPPIVAYIAAWLGIGVAVFALFEKGEDALRQEAKSDISRWLQNVDPTGVVGSWPGGFVMLFDSVFGERHFTKRCFFRSCVASLLAILTASTLIYALNPLAFTREVNYLLVPPWQGDWPFGSAFVLQAVVLTLIVGANLLGDYLSLLKARYLLQWMSKVRIGALLTVGLLADATATIIIWAIGLLGAALVVSLFANVELDLASWPSQLWHAILVIPHPASWNDDSLTLSMLGAAFFTSLWAWLYALASLVVRGAYAIKSSLGVFRSVFDVENKPLRSIGVVCNLGITAAFIVRIVL
jgi:hypothetical protein